VDPRDATLQCCRTSRLVTQQRTGAPGTVALEVARKRDVFDAADGDRLQVRSEHRFHSAFPARLDDEILSETIGGRIQFAWVPIVSSMGLLRDGKLLPLAVSTPKRVAALPDVPTIAEAGFPGGEFIFWLGLLAPAHVPRDIITKLNGEVTQSLQSADVKQRLEKLGAEPMSMTPEQFDRFIADEYAVLGELMRKAGAKAQ